MAPRIDRRQQLLGKARDVFAKHGYHAAKVDDIIAAAGVARGTFYLYFSDKRAAFEELVDRFFARIAMTIQRVDTDEPVEAQVRHNIRGILALLLEDRAMAKILLADAVGVDPTFDAKLRRFYDEIEVLFTASLAEGQQLGLVRAGDPRLMVFFTLGGLKETLVQVITRELEYPVEALVDAVYALLLDGFLVAQVHAPGDERNARAARSQEKIARGSKSVRAATSTIASALDDTGTSALNSANRPARRDPKRPRARA